jgi:hypothetical protein
MMNLRCPETPRSLITLNFLLKLDVLNGQSISDRPLIHVGAVGR